MIITRCIVGLLLVVLLLPAHQVKAAASTFTTTQQVGEDNAPPTVPDPVTITPIAATQIDIEWGASTDTFGVAGYQLFRDGIQIATTTATIYFDTNLQPETLYSYYLTAFDAAGNVSTSSVTVATTTLALPVIPVATTTPESSSSASRIQLLERNFALVPDTNSARFTWETNIPTQFVLRYGLTREMDDEILQTTIYRREHSTLISGLTADTEYFYELLLIDSYGREVVLRAGQFRTAEGVDSTPPANVQNLAGQVVSNDVYLSWRNPTDSDFAYVRVVRNFRFFPQNPTDGFVVYEGDASSVIDQGVLGERGQQYYTVFAFDSSGNRSSGAVVRVQTASGLDTNITPPVSPDIDDERTTTSVPVDLDQMRLQAEDIVFWQGNSRIVVVNGLITLRASDTYEISVPAAAVPNHLKSIIVTVQHPTDNNVTQSFLLRYDEASDSYLAGIAPFGVLGDSTFTVAVYDYTAAVVHEVTLPVRFVRSEDAQSPFVPEYVSYAWSVLWPLIQLLVIGFLLVWFLVLLRRRQSDVDEVMTNEDNR